MSRSIQVFVDMAVDPAREQEMLQYFETTFRPAAKKFRGYLDVNLLKLRSVIVGKAAAGMNYRFEISYESEELRQKWVTSDIHAEVWGTLEKFASPDYIVLLFDVVT
jgi:heme-degrading monooxygenase HmoA